MTAREAEIIELIRKEVKPALGCTEPIAVALAVAKAMEIVDEKLTGLNSGWKMSDMYRLKVEVSGNILKNGMGVGIPGTGMVGLHIAAALGAVCGKSSYGLEVLHDLNSHAVEHSKRMVADGMVNVGLADTKKKLYVKATVEVADRFGYAVIEDDHDNIVETAFNGTILHSSRTTSENRGGTEAKTTLDYNLTVKEIFEFAKTVSYGDIEFILESRTLNVALA